MKVGWVWAVYVVVVLILFLLLSWSQMSKVGRGIAALIALVVGALVVFVASMSVPKDLTKAEQNWLSLLMIIAYILPIFAIIYVAWSGEYRAISGDACATEKTVICDEATNKCSIVQESTTCGTKKTNTFFI